MVLPVVTYNCESQTIKKAEHQRIDAFELWCWRWLLRVPWTARRSNQSILREINPEYSLEGLMLKLKLQYLGHLMQTAYSLEMYLMLGKTEGRRRERQRMRSLDGITDAMDMNLSKLQEVVRNREAWCAAVHWVAKNWTWLSNFNQRRQWHPTPVLLTGKSHGQRTLAGSSPSGRNESDMTERLHFHFHALEKEMATHSSVLAWRIPGTAEPGGLPSMGSQSQTRLKCLSSSSRATLTPFHFHSKHCSVKTRTLEPKATRAFISFVARQFGLIYLTRILSHVRD